MIRGFFDSRDQWPVPRLRVAVYIPGIKEDWVYVNFVIDTGSSSTCLHPLDATIGMGIAPGRLALPQFWTEQTDHGGIGGSALYFPVEAHYAFLREDDEWKIIEDRIEIAQLRAANTQLPSLLGWNVLKHFRLNIDHSGGIVELDDPQSS